jgi:hypothetical protein
MNKNLPLELAPFFHQFSWDVRKVWKLNCPIQVVDIDVVSWHLRLPFWSSQQGSLLFDVIPLDVINNPKINAYHSTRIDMADVGYPMEFMMSNGRPVVLDGLHRLAKIFREGNHQVNIRIIPREHIPDIVI